MSYKYATGVVNPKITSLFFDKIWIPNPENIVDEQERIILSKIPEDIILKFYYDEYRKKTLESIFFAGARSNAYYNKINTSYIDYQFSEGRNASLLFISSILSKYLGCEVTPIFFDKTEYEKSLNYPSENKNMVKRDSIEFCIKNIPIIVEKDIEWQQVVEFRKDKESKKAIKRLIRWIDIDYYNKGDDELREVLNKELDEYSFAIKKHGLQTALGAITSILSTSSTIANMITGDHTDIVVGGASISALLISNAVSKYIEFSELKRKPIALLYNISKL